MRSPFHGKDAILSGPAGGIVGAARAARAAGFDKIIAFDMGGTSTDVAHYAGEYERALDAEVAGVRLRTPMMQHPHGRRRRRLDLQLRRRAPARRARSPRARIPGPASYRRGGPLTVTDCNVLLGRIQPDFFPGVVRRGRRSAARCRRRARASSRRSRPIACPARDGRRRRSPPAASASPSRTWRTPSRRSPCSAATTSPSTRSPASAAPRASTPAWSPTRSACSSVFIHPLAGVLSAYGIGLADTLVMRQQTVEVPLERRGARAAEARRSRRSSSEARAELLAAGIRGQRGRNSSARVLLKYEDTDSTLTLPLLPDSTAETLTAEFLAQYRTRYRLSRAGTRASSSTPSA